MAERFDLKNIIKYFETICLPLTFCELRDVHKRPVAFERNEFLCTRHAIDACEQQFEFQELLKDLVPSQVCSVTESSSQPNEGSDSFGDKSEPDYIDDRSEPDDTGDSNEPSDTGDSNEPDTVVDRKEHSSFTEEQVTGTATISWMGMKFSKIGPGSAEAVEQATEIYKATTQETLSKESLKPVSLAKQVDIRSPAFQQAVKRLNDCLTEENLQSLKTIAEKNMKEEEITVGIGVHLLSKLAGSAYISEKFRKNNLKCPCGCQSESLSFSAMYIGEENTWHGELDLVSGDEPKNPCKSYSCVNVATAVDISGDTGSDTNAGGDQSSKINDSNSSPGNPTNIEFKETVPNDIVQMISQAIVFGFTEYNRHKDYSPYIPTVCIDKQRFLIFIYNPVQDTLMASISSLRFFPFKSHLEIFALWVVLNHRLFFRKQIDIKEIPCGFQTQVEVEPYKHLSKYKSIVKSHWDGITFPDFHASILYCHPKKRKVPFTE